MNTPPLKALAISHVDFEDLGVLKEELQRRHFDVQHVDAPTADWAEVSRTSPALVMVLGGPLGVEDVHAYPFLKQELDFIETCLDKKVPMVGVCLGAQLIAKALGADVKAMGAKEIGFSTLILTDEGTRSPLQALLETPVLHWHGDRFEIPAQAANLAKTAVCDHQAFAIGSHVLGLQFHMEVNTENIERWLVGNATELAIAGIDPHTLREQAQMHGPRLASAAKAAFNGWLDAALPSTANDDQPDDTQDRR